MTDKKDVTYQDLVGLAADLQEIQTKYLDLYHRTLPGKVSRKVEVIRKKLWELAIRKL